MRKGPSQSLEEVLVEGVQGDDRLGLYADAMVAMS